MNCLICNSTQISSYGNNAKNFPIEHCESCNLYYVKTSHTPSQEYLKERYKENFWRDANYNIEEMIKSDFTNKEGKHFALNWSSMYSYCKKFLSSKKSILEIGVGTGVHTIMFDKLGFDVTGIEPDAFNAKLINEKLKNGKCINGMLEDISLQKKFDIIYLYHVVEHVPRPDQFLRKCSDLLDENGYLIIAVPDCGNAQTLNNSISNTDHIWHFSKLSLMKLSTKLGLKIHLCDSLATIKQLNTQRIYRILNRSGLAKLCNIIWPYWPLKITNKNDGYEIRMILSKSHLNSTLN
jgi:2-polyprenyl-3-methyl-5-hydroxy-6-metoxy-1,4-benzoquinol methylase